MLKRLITPPATQPIGQLEIDEHLRADTAKFGQTLYIEGLIKSAVSRAQQKTGRVFITQTWAAIFRDWSEMESCVLPFGELQSVTSVKYNDAAGAVQTVAPGEYLVNGIGTDDGRIIIPSHSGFEYPDLYEQDPVTVTFVCGYGLAGDVPEDIKTGIKLLVSEVYEDADVEAAVNSFLEPYKLPNGYGGF